MGNMTGNVNNQGNLGQFIREAVLGWGVAQGRALA